MMATFTTRFPANSATGRSLSVSASVAHGLPDGSRLRDIRFVGFGQLEKSWLGLGEFQPGRPMSAAMSTWPRARAYDRALTHPYIRAGPSADGRRRCRARQAELFAYSARAFFFFFLDQIAGIDGLGPLPASTRVCTVCGLVAAVTESATAGGSAVKVV